MQQRFFLKGGFLLLALVALALLVRPASGTFLGGGFFPDIFGIIRFFKTANDWAPAALKVASGPTGIVTHALVYASQPVIDFLQTILSSLSPGSVVYKLVEAASDRIIEGVGSLIIDFFWWILSLKKDFVVLVVEVIGAAVYGSFSYIQKTYFPDKAGGTQLTIKDLDNLFYIEPFLDRFDNINKIVIFNQLNGDKDKKAEGRINGEVETEAENWRKIISNMKNKDPDGCFLIYLCGLQSSQSSLLLPHENYLRDHFRQYAEHLGNESMTENTVCGAQVPSTQDQVQEAVTTVLASSRKRFSVPLVVPLPTTVNEARKRKGGGGKKKTGSRDSSSTDNEMCEFLKAIFPYAKATWVGKKSPGQLKACSDSYSRCPHEFSDLQYTVNMALSLGKILASWTT